MSVIPKPRIPESDYLYRESLADQRHEYINGELYAMAGASADHNQITLNVPLALAAHLYALSVRRTGHLSYEGLEAVINFPTINWRGITPASPLSAHHVLLAPFGSRPACILCGRRA